MYVCIHISIDHFSFDTDQPLRTWNEMFSAVSTLQRPYYCTVLCVYVLQAVLGGSSNIRIFICQCFGFFDWGSSIRVSFSYYSEVLWDDVAYHMNLLTVKFWAWYLYVTRLTLLTVVRWCPTFQVMKWEDVSCYILVNVVSVNFQHLFQWAVIMCCLFLFFGIYFLKSFPFLLSILIDLWQVS